MASYTLSYTGPQIDSLLGAVSTAVTGNGIVNVSGLNTILGSYLTSSSAANTYLTQSDASNTYLTKTDASSTYLSKTDASSTYAPLTGTGTSGTWPISISGSSASCTGSSASCSGNAATATTATNVSWGPLTTISKSITVTTSWQNTGISGTDLATGTYIVQVSGFPNNYCSLWSEVFCGIMQWHSSGTNDTHAQEITLHNAGHASNGGYIKLRTLHNGGGVLTLQIMGSASPGSACTVTFKFRRII